MISKYSIAVLPFVNMSSDTENEYFSDGITEEIISALSKIEGLHVTARTSSFVFKSQNIDIREIGTRLNVAFILEGSIRKADGKVRITAQLSETERGFHIWSDSWDRELKDIFILQDEMAGLIASKVNANVRQKPKGGIVLEDTNALDAYLRANYLLNTWDFSKGKEMLGLFQKAVDLDKKLIKAYVGMSNAYTWLGSTGHVLPNEAQAQIEKCIAKVLELDPNLPDVYTLMASKYFWMEWNIALALENIDKALSLKPSYPEALMYKGLFLAASGRVEEGLDHFFQADRLDPYANQINSGIGMIYSDANENEKALEYLEKNIRIAPYWDAQYLFKVEVLCKLKRFNEAWAEIENIGARPNNPLSIADLKAYFYASKGETRMALEQVEKMKEEYEQKVRHGSPDSTFLSQIYLLLGENEKALDYLEKGIEEKAAPILFNKINALWDGLRDNHRYIAAMKSVTYPSDYPEKATVKGKYARSTLRADEAVQYLEKLNRLMNSEKPWINPTLNLTDLAELIDVSPHLLSRVLNEYAQTNFYDYVNSFRLKHFKQICHKSAYKNYTLLSMAYECGFNSKTTFNAFFKKTMGITPNEYYRQG
ncbi:MAG: helix-turn-helix domain-containing protein [Prolixibacteraceae bacterium]|nr:helix-turn-helix domain-containing protein [Prolixibacteraceae bacterium]